MAGRILEELKQTKPFPSLGEEAVVSIMRTAAVLEHALSDALKGLGLTLTQYNVLRILRGAGEPGLCGREIGDRLVTQVPDVPRILERMSAAGFIVRERDARDRRHVTARITDTGRDLLARADANLDPIADQRFGDLPKADLENLLTALEVVRGAT